MARVENSVHSRFLGDSEYDQAERIYNTIRRRIKGRFQHFGRVPGKIFLLSSSQYPGDFTDRKITEAATDPTIYVLKKAQWETIPEDKFCGEKFPVVLGDQFQLAHVLDSESQIKPDDQVLWVPVEYKTEFKKDTEGALRDFAGVATATRHPFIPYREAVQRCQDDYVAATGGLTLFLQEEITLSDDHDFSGDDFDGLINPEYFEAVGPVEAPHAVHIDLGLSGDGAGFGIGHIVGFMLLESVTVFDPKSNEFVQLSNHRAPIYHGDFLRIKARKGWEIDVISILQLVTYLKRFVDIKWGTADWYQSVTLLQGMRKLGIRSGTLSVDTSLAPMVELKQSVKDARFRFKNSILADEMRSLERSGDKVDHPPGGSKDVADAAAGVVYMLYSRESVTTPQRRSSSARHRRTTQSMLNSGDRSTARRIRFRR